MLGSAANRRHCIPGAAFGRSPPLILESAGDHEPRPTLRSRRAARRGEQPFDGQGVRLVLEIREHALTSARHNHEGLLSKVDLDDRRAENDTGKITSVSRLICVSAAAIACRSSTRAHPIAAPVAIPSLCRTRGQRRAAERSTIWQGAARDHAAVTLTDSLASQPLAQYQR